MTEMLARPGPESLASSNAGADGGPQEGAPEHVLVCTGFEDVTHDMRTFAFEPAGPGSGPGTHDPGQYLTFTFDVGGREAVRCYTISSPPTRPGTLAITVKRVPGGLVSNWLHDHLAPGRAVRARGPFGDFSTARHPAPAYLFLSAGSGVTPLMSMTRALHDGAAPADVIFVHSARTPEDIPFRRELEVLAATAPGLRVIHVCEADGAVAGWAGERGRLTSDVLLRVAPDFLAREVFVCGPAGYMDAARRLLSAAGLPEDRYHQESFTGPAAPAGAADPGASTTFSVALSRSGTTIECEAGVPVLDAAARAGITLPSSCGQGLCGSCVTTLEKGSVDMRDNGGLRPRDRAQNKILLCCSTPLENLVIDA